MTKLFVGNLSHEVTEDDLRTAFAAYGPVASAAIVTDRDDGRSKGFGFVEMSSNAAAMAAIQGLDGTGLKGRDMNVSRARSRNDGGGRGDPPRSRGWAVVGSGRDRW